MYVCVCVLIGFSFRGVFLADVFGGYIRFRLFFVVFIVLGKMYCLYGLFEIKRERERFWVYVEVFVIIGIGIL